MVKARRGRNSRGREKHEAAGISKNNQVTRINPREKTSMAEAMCEACLFPCKKKKHPPHKKTSRLNSNGKKIQTHCSGAEQD